MAELEWRFELHQLGRVGMELSGRPPVCLKMTRDYGNREAPTPRMRRQVASRYLGSSAASSSGIQRRALDRQLSPPAMSCDSAAGDGLTQKSNPGAPIDASRTRSK